MIRIISFEHVDPKRENCWSCEEFKNALIPKATINSEAAPIHIIKRTVSVIYFISSRYNTAQNIIRTINEQIQNIAQKKDTLCRRMYN